MSACNFRAQKFSAPYKIVDNLYDTRKDFIVLGLCGKVGSGVSTVSKLLEKNFDDLQLPQPGFGNSDLLAEHEYRILYTYAKKNWESFFKIRTSALITRHILSFTPEKFANFLGSMYEKDLGDNIAPEFRDIVKDFFEKDMEFDLKQYFEVLNYDINDYSTPGEFLNSDKDFKGLADDISSFTTRPVKYECNLPETKNIEFEYNVTTNICSFKNQALSQMLESYAACRREKAGFKNPFWYLILQQYIYNFLPKASSELWNSIREKSKRLPTQALQYLGNNLRIAKTPYIEPEENAFAKDAYTCLAEDINLAIKVLRAYQLKLQENKLETDTKEYRPHQTYQNVRTIIVIDSIKNPYESMYLKARYSNYYLIGIYTEDVERRKRLREVEHFIDDDINAIDIIEQNSAFKKEIRRYYGFLENQKKEDTGSNHTTRNEHSTPFIIKMMYNQFQKLRLLDDLPYISPFILQNVSSCLDSADILINNRPDNESYFYLKKTLLRYVCLIMNPALVLPTAVERCMQIAYTAKLNSGCISRQVGAVLTDSRYHLLSIGWNQQPEGQLPCSYRDLCELYHHWAPDGYSDYENNDNDGFQENIIKQVEEFFDTADSPLREKGKLPCYCFKDYYNKITGDRNQVHTRALHAEETAFLNLGSNNERVANGILFTTSSPCELCSKKAMFLGISTIYYVEPYAGVSQKHVMSIWMPSCRPNLVLFTGATGTAYTKLYTPLLPQKDENEMWLGAQMDIGLVDKLKAKSTGFMKPDETD